MEPSKKVILAGLMMGLFLAAIDATVVATAMPKVVSSLSGIEFYSWIFTAYILTATVSGPLWGRISDLHGRRRVYIIGVLFFLVGSALSGTATTMPQLVIFRSIQGLGAGALLVMTFTVVGEIFRLKERARVTGYTGSVWAVASLLGPPAGGFIADNLDWRWVFYINIPFGLVAMLIAWRNLRDDRERVNGSIDIPGASLFALGSVMLLAFLNEYSTPGGLGFMFLAVGIVSLLLFAYVERKSDAPFIPLHLFREPLVRTAISGNFLAGLAFFGSIAYIPLLLQWVMGLSATNSGFALIPYTLSWVISANLAARLLIRLGTKPITTAGALSMTLGMLILVFARPHIFDVLAAGSLAGGGLGAIVSTLLISTQTIVSRQVLGIATSLLSFLRLMGGALGVALMWIPISGALVTSEINPATTNASLNMELKLALSSALSQSFTVGLIAAALSLPLYLSLPKIILKDTKT